MVWVHQSWLVGPRGLKGSPLNRASVLYHLGLLSMKMLYIQVGSNGFSEFPVLFLFLLFSVFLSLIIGSSSARFWVAWKRWKGAQYVICVMICAAIKWDKGCTHLHVHLTHYAICATIEMKRSMICALRNMQYEMNNKHDFILRVQIALASE